MTGPREPSWPLTRWCGRCKGKGRVPRALLPGDRTCPRCEGDRITCTLLGSLLDARLARRARR